MATVTATLEGDRVRLRVSGWLGDRFEGYRRAIRGARFDPVDKSNLVPPDAVSTVLDRLFHLEGVDLQTDEGVANILGARCIAAVNDAEAAGARLDATDRALSKRGMALYPYQRDGVRWLAPRDKAILGDDMGCLSGDAVVHVNRAGGGRRYKLSDVYHRFNGIGRYAWDRTIPTFMRALCGDQLRQHLVTHVLYKGRRRVVRITTKRGKELVLTPDHEVARADGAWPCVSDLRPGDEVLSNGKAVCFQCGGPGDIIKYPYAKFFGWCKTCMYRVGRKNHRSRDGRSIDSDGYVRVSGQQDHPRANAAGQVYEHILVMEAHLGRPVVWPEQVHHRNEDRADNRIDNLELVTPSTHHRRHDKHLHMDGGISGNGGDVLFVPRTDEVVSIVDAGMEDVYDVVMHDPHRNFVANGLIVHNCGKTVQALIAAPQEAPILVVGPAVAKGVWQRETEKWRPDLAVRSLQGRGAFSWPRPGELVVTNYAILPQVNAKCPLPPTPQGVVVIADEAHRIKTYKAQRTQRMRKILKAARVAGGKSWLLTATPLLNKPPELWSMLQALGAGNAVFGDYFRFCRMLGGVQVPVPRPRVPFDKWPKAWKWDGSADRIDPRVPGMLAEIMLRRLKVDVLKDLPPKRRRTIPVSIKAARYLDKAQGSLDLGDITLDSVPFTEMSAVRAKLASDKIKALLELVEAHEEAGEPLVVFSSHRAPIDEVGARDGWAAITGDVPPDERTAIEDRFQAGQLRGVALTIKAGGESLTLTRAAHSIFVDLDPVPAMNAQAEDRIYRIGQDQAVLITVLEADHPLDRRINELILAKQALIDQTVNAAARR